MKLDQKQFNTLAAGVILVAAIIVYSNTFRVPFQFDDIYHIFQKKLVQDLSNFGKLSTWANINDRPLPMLTIALNYRWGDSNMMGYHIFNLILHILTGWVVYSLVLNILSLKNTRIGSKISDHKQSFALLAALLFVAHPLQTQAVTYIIQRITVLVALFYLSGVLFYIKGRKAQIEAGDLPSSIKYYVMAVIAFILAMLSKQTAVTFPLALLLVELFFIRDKQGKLLKKTVIGLSAGVVIYFAAGLALVGLPRESEDIPRDVYLYTSFRMMVKYIQMFILPIGQNIDHDIKASGTLFDWRELGSLAIIVGLLYLAYRTFKKNPLVSFGIVWFFITLLVVQSIIPIKDFMFEHRLYLPMFGLIMASLAALYTYLPQAIFRKSKLPAAAALTMVMIIAYGSATYARNKVWQSELSLWSDSAKKSPEKGRPHLWLGIAYAGKGNLDAALENLNRSIELVPGFPMGYYNRGNIYKDRSKFQEALADYDKAIALDPDYMLAYFNRGVVRAKLGQHAKAIEDYTATIKFDRKNTDAFYNRGNAYRNLRQYEEAISDYNKAVEIDPSYTLAIYNRGLSKAGLKLHDEAIRDFDLALRLEPNNDLIYNGKGVSLYALKRYDEALVNYDAAIRINPNFGQAFYNRAFVKYMGMNDKEGGCQDWQKALSLKYKQAEFALDKFCKAAKSTGKNTQQKKTTSQAQKKSTAKKGKK